MSDPRSGVSPALRIATILAVLLAIAGGILFLRRPRAAQPATPSIAATPAPLSPAPPAPTPAVQAEVHPAKPRDQASLPPGPNAGEIEIVNQTESEATIRITTPSAPGAVLNTTVVPADSTAIARSLKARSYLIDIRFSDRRFPPLHLGPYEIDQTHTPTETRADRYMITLKPNVQ